MERTSFDISELYDLFCERKDCYFICADIRDMIAINHISHKAGDLAILETLKRLDEAAGENDLVFRIGGDEFCMLTRLSPTYCQKMGIHSTMTIQIFHSCFMCAAPN